MFYSSGGEPMARVPEVALKALSVGTRTVAPAQSSPEFITRKPEERGAGLHVHLRTFLTSSAPLPAAQWDHFLPLPSGIRRAAHMWREGVALTAAC